MDLSKFNLPKMMSQAKALQETLAKEQEALTQKHQQETTWGESGAGDVKVELTLDYKVKGCWISPETLQQPGEIVGQLVASAMNQALARATTQIESDKKALASKLKVPFDMPEGLST